MNHDRKGDAETQEPQSIEVTLDRVVWFARDSSFVVCRIRIDDDLFPLAAVGEMLSPSPGDRYVLHGKWETHARYGRQFRFVSYEQKYPETAAGMERYLGSGILPGTGQETARRIVAHFGDRTLEVMNNEIQRLREINGIGEKKLETIQREWDRLQGVHNVMVFLRAHNISSAWAVRIFRAYGGDAMRIMRENPYRLIEDIEGLGFLVADGIATSLGIQPGDERRIVAGMSYALREAARRHGHTCVPEEDFFRRTASLLKVEDDQVREGFARAREQGSAFVEDGYVYVPELLHAEKRIAEELKTAFCEEWNGLDHLGLDERLAAVERQRAIRLNAQQVEAVHKCLAGPVCILTGGPGTGKTTTLTGILDLASGLKWKIALCAPTGRAAKRITEITGHEARTIHRLLEFDPAEMVFRRNDERRLEADILVVDEMSMVDIPLMAALLRARPSGCRLVLVGDADQLPSVGPGSVLRDLLSCGDIDRVILHLVFRQAADSSIITNAHRMREGYMPKFDTKVIGVGETFFKEVSADEQLADLVRALVAERIPEEFDCDPIRDIQVLSPMYDTPAGVTHLNSVLQQAVNGSARTLLQRGDRTFRLGDKVMQTRNDYEKEVYNGDIGFVRDYDEEGGALVVGFDDRSVTYTPEESDDLVLAYAITVHKSQGSEYEVVIMPVVMQHRIMLRRNLVYTAMTRARRVMLFLGQRNALSIAVANAREQRRYGLLAQRISEALR
ncbi:MAG: ATP-dependent RecD-like DNA helicase [Bacteroidetes bacterium]|nr:ATP-dependent RecD-like DNA helicase [Bacteroidota bacterium]